VLDELEDGDRGLGDEDEGLDAHGVFSLWGQVAVALLNG
jgi:hypothetical protein